jgi:hypothetical protein
MGKHADDIVSNVSTGPSLEDVMHARLGFTGIPVSSVDAVVVPPGTRRGFLLPGVTRRRADRRLIHETRSSNTVSLQCGSVCVRLGG